MIKDPFFGAELPAVFPKSDRLNKLYTIQDLWVNVPFLSHNFLACCDKLDGFTQDRKMEFGLLVSGMGGMGSDDDEKDDTKASRYKKEREE